ncbi:MAG TPA: LLM class flavin-dependent oxidoreductase [Gaiellaceae bacterium]|nr:LLM class flavin-dependent oxidoreductase [Gaiellaceae bacterium]
MPRSRGEARDAGRAAWRANARDRGADVVRELGIGLRTDLDPASYEAIAHRVDGAGIDVISVFHDLLYQPAIGPLLLMARVTEQVRLGPAALNPFTLHPYEIAGQIAMLDAVSDGRAYLGLAKGAWLDRLGIEEERPLVALREAVAIIRALLAGDDRGIAGERFTLAPGTKLAYLPTRVSVPLTIGTWGPKTARWAGTVADEVKLGGSANPDLVPVVREWIGNPEVGLVVGCVTVVDEDGDWARERVGDVVEHYLEVVAHLDPTLEGRDGRPPPLERFTIAGTPEEVADRVTELWDAGAARVELGTPQGRTPASGIDLICDRVLPLLGR